MKLLHFIYVLIGRLICKIGLCYWSLRDLLSPPKSNAILFVAHPDDDTLFFHTFIKEHKPYVVLCTTGWSLRRLPCFIKTMRNYGVRYKAYDLESRDTRVELLEKYIHSSMLKGEFDIVATHNAQGEYGHEMHRRVHHAVMKYSQIPVFVPVCAEKILDFPLDEYVVAEKKDIFNNIYTTESWVLEQYAEWVGHEKLERVK